MRGFQGTGWLLVGLVLAVITPAAGLDSRLLAWLGGIAPLPWGQILLSLLLFWAGAALYFRSHWAATTRRLRRDINVRRRAAQAMAGIVSDAERWTFVLRDNLAEVGDTRLPDRTRSLYLDGAVAHADKMKSVIERCRGVLEDLDPDGEAFAANEQDSGVRG